MCLLSFKCVRHLKQCIHNKEYVGWNQNLMSPEVGSHACHKLSVVVRNSNAICMMQSLVQNGGSLFDI